MRDLLLAAVVFGALPFVLKRPFIGVLLLAWLGYMNPHKLAWGFMMTMPVVQIVTLATLGGLLISREVKRMIWSREVIILLIFVTWMGITTTQAFYYGFAIEQYSKIIKIQILTFVTLLLLTSRERVHLFVWVLVISLAFYGIKGGLFTIAKGGVHRIWGPTNTFIGGNNELALALVMTIPLMRYLHLQENNMWLKAGLTVAMPLTAICAVGSQSRGALVALLITGAFFWIKSKGKILSLVVILIGMVFVVNFMPESYWSRMDTIKTYEEDGSALGRINAWWVAWNVAKSHLFGGGFEMFQWDVFQAYAPDPERIHDVHSIYFEVLGEHGFVGLFLFLSLLVLTWRKCSATVRLAKSDESLKWAGELSAMIQVSLVAYMVGGAFLGLAYFDYPYHLIALSVVVYELASTVQPRNRVVAEGPIRSLSSLAGSGSGLDLKR